LCKRYFLSKVTKKLSERSLDGSPQNLKMFLERLAARVAISCWKSITKLGGKYHVTQYDRIDIAECKNEAEEYLGLDKFTELDVKK